MVSRLHQKTKRLVFWDKSTLNVFYLAKNEILKCSFHPQGHSAEIISCSFNTTGDQLLTGSFDHTVSVWDTATGRLVLIVINRSPPKLYEITSKTMCTMIMTYTRGYFMKPL